MMANEKFYELSDHARESFVWSELNKFWSNLNWWRGIP
jgi:hypothetical protein